jgi:hypothetical protein
MALYGEAGEILASDGLFMGLRGPRIKAVGTSGLRPHGDQAPARGPGPKHGDQAPVTNFPRDPLPP